MADESRLDGKRTYLPEEMRRRIMGSVAGQYSESLVNELRRSVVANFEELKAAPLRQEFVIPQQVVSKYVCSTCGNREQTHFMHDARNGDVVCLGVDGQGCGSVVEDHKMHEGNQYRKFEGEEDKSHHGPVANKLFSASHNMRTNLNPMSGAGSSRAARLRQTAEQVELGLSNLGRKDERRTREGYKDAQKKKAFDKIEHQRQNFGLHLNVAERAKALFASWRDAKEALHNFDAVITACLLEAAEESARDEHFRPKPLVRGPEPGDVPLVGSRVDELLSRPVAAARTKRPAPQGDADSKAPPTKTNRAGKDWLNDLPDLSDDDD